jgi:uncharacterized protein YjiS (DUF1127 family)
MLNVNYHHPLLTRLAIRQQAGFGHTLGFVKTLMRRYKDRRELNDLLRLSDYQLKDIGLTRGDIQRESIKPFWKV